MPARPPPPLSHRDGLTSCRTFAEWHAASLAVQEYTCLGQLLAQGLVERTRMNDMNHGASDNQPASLRRAPRRWQVLGAIGTMMIAGACSSGQREPQSALRPNASATVSPLPVQAKSPTADRAATTVDADASVALPKPDPRLREVANSPYQWTGIAVLPGPTLFVNFPRWGGSSPYSVAQIGAGGELTAFPDQRWNTWKPGEDPKRAFVCVQSVVAGPDGTLWVLDPASPEFRGVVEGGAKLVVFSSKTRTELRRFEFVPPVIRRESYLNDVRILNDRSYAFITDSGIGGLVVVDLLSGRSRRVLDDSAATHSTGATLTFPFGAWARNGQRPEIHSDGIALSRDQQWLYFHALTGDTLFRVPVKALTDSRVSSQALLAQVERVASSAPVDGLETSPDGTLYLTGLETYSIRRLTADGQIEEWLRDRRLVWPDSIAFSSGGTLYVTTSQIQHGQQPPEPYRIFAVETR